MSPIHHHWNSPPLLSRFVLPKEILCKPSAAKSFKPFMSSSLDPPPSVLKGLSGRIPKKYTFLSPRVNFNSFSSLIPICNPLKISCGPHSTFPQRVSRFSQRVHGSPSIIFLGVHAKSSRETSQRVSEETFSLFSGAPESSRKSS